MHHLMAQAIGEGRAAPFAAVGVDGGESYRNARADGEGRMAMPEQEGQSP
jgi:hypothetical protein